MNKIAVFLAFALLLFGCVGIYETTTEPVYTSYENATGGDLSALRIGKEIENDQISISEDKKTAEFYFTPEEEFDTIKEVSDFSLML